MLKTLCMEDADRLLVRFNRRRELRRASLSLPAAHRMMAAGSVLNSALSRPAAIPTTP
jgi:hypothetical protein